MRHIVHIVTKDLRQAWPYGAAALAVLIVNTANFARVLATRGTEQAAALGIQVPLDWLLAITWALYYGVVLLGDTIPGTRQHWISRPLRWQSLLAAKLLLLPIFALPVAAAHLVQLSLRGFPLADHAAPVIANAFWLVFAGLLPVATLASLCRNLQQLALWILALAAGILALQQWDAALPAALQGVVDDATVAAAILACAGILLWQYATRRTTPARIATVALALVIATLPHWPSSLWRNLTHTPNSPATLAVSPPIEWNGGGLRIPLQTGNLSPKFILKRDDLHVRLSTYLTATTDVKTIDPYEFERDGELNLDAPAGFFFRNAKDPMDIEITGEFIVFSAPIHQSVPTDGERFLPGIGRCQSWFDKLQIIECQSVLGAANRLEIVPVWKLVDHLNANKFTALASASAQSPLALVPEFHPIGLLSGDMPAYWKKEDSSEIRLSTRKPIAHIKRSLQLRGVVLEDIPSFPKRQTPQKQEPAPLGGILNPPPPKPNSPIADHFIPHNAPAKAPQ